MHIKSIIILFSTTIALIFVACSSEEPRKIQDVIDNETNLKPIQLTIDDESVYRSDVVLGGPYNNTKELLYNTVIEDLRLAGYRILSEAESKTRVLNKLKIKYKEDSMDEEWRICYPDRLGCPKKKGTKIKCEVELKNFTTNIDKKETIYADTKLSPNTGDPYRNIPGEKFSMERVIYFSAFLEFNKELSDLINQVFVTG